MLSTYFILTAWVLNPALANRSSTLCFMLSSDLVNSLLQLVGRCQLEDAQHHKCVPDDVLKLRLVIFCCVCASLLLNLMRVLGTKMLPHLVFLCIMFFPALLPRAALCE